MNEKSRRRAMAVVTVIVLALGALGLLSVELAGAESPDIEGEVTKEGTIDFLPGVEVTLLDAHGQKSFPPTLTGEDGAYTFSPSPGFYYIRAAKDGFFDAETAVFRFDGTARVEKNIALEEMPPTDFTLTVRVKDGGGPLPNATVGLFNSTREQTIDTQLTNSTGNATFLTWAGTFELRVEKQTFEKAVEPISISGNDTREITLSPGIKLVGRAKAPDGSFIGKGLVAYLYNTDVGTQDAKRLLVANVTGSSYTFHAYTGDFILIVDADGKAANITQITVMGAGRINRTLRDSPQERVNVTIQYVLGDWNNLTLQRELALNEDSAVSGLSFGFIRNLRLQIDLALGDGDGTLEPGEINVFRDWLLNRGPKHVNTTDFFTTNSQHYLSDLVGSQTDYSVTVDIPGQGEANIVSVTNYTVVGNAIPGGRERYYVNTSAPHDTDGIVRVNHTYAIDMVAGYERVSVAVTGNVAVSGYTTVQVDPASDTGDFNVGIVAEPSLNGTARAQVIGPPSRFTELNVTAENYTALVPTGVDVTLSAEESTDPNSPDGRVSPDSNFTWEFTNLSLPEPITVYGIRPDVNFTVQGNYSGDLTIVETGGNVTLGGLTLIVDGLPPIARIENNITGLGVNANGTQADIQEDSAIRFFGGNSTDMVHDELEGKIGAYRWDMDGDGEVDATGATVEWTFSEPGNFTVDLIAVDQAGHESSNATMWVVVGDITSPEAVLEILDEDFQEAVSFMEGRSYYFDATASSDNFDALENLTFEWSFGDGNTTTGSNVTHVYENFGDYDVTLNVTDVAGNVGNATRSLSVGVDPPTRPDLEIETDSLVIDPRSPEESTFFGQVVVTIRLNVTNKEDRAIAEDVRVTFWAFRFGEEAGEPIFIVPTFDGDSTNNTLQPGDTKTVEFTWVTPAQGNYTLRVNVTDPREPEIFKGPRNTVQTQIDVRQAGWKTPLTIAAIVGVIAGIPTAIYLRRRYRTRIRERITKK